MRPAKRLDNVPMYVFAAHGARLRKLAEDGLDIIRLDIGEPDEPPPAFIIDAMEASANNPKNHGYAGYAGRPELKRAIVDYYQSRFGVTLDGASEVLPLIGSKEGLAHIALAWLDPGDIAIVPDPGYPTYQMGAKLADADVYFVSLEQRLGWLPDLQAIPDDVARRARLMWVSYPNNPTGASASRGFYAEALDLARRLGFWLASDEAYSEIYFGDPPPSALQEGLENLLVFQTLSKRSAMTGYRSGFMAGDRELIEMLRRVRPSQGVATPTFIQEAATAAWCEESHVAVLRDIYRRKRVLLRGVLERAGLEIARSDATFFLYFRAPAGETSASFAERMLEHGIAMAPGEMFGATGEGWVRMALVPTEEECAHAAALLERHLGDR